MSLKNQLERLFQEAAFTKQEYEVAYENDTGPNDEGFWEWNEVAGGKFDDEDKAQFVAVLLTAYKEGKLVIKE